MSIEILENRNRFRKSSQNWDGLEIGVPSRVVKEILVENLVKFLGQFFQIFGLIFGEGFLRFWKAILKRIFN